MRERVFIEAVSCKARRVRPAVLPAGASLEDLKLLTELDANRPRLRRNDVRLIAGRRRALDEARELGALVKHVRQVKLPG